MARAIIFGEIPGISEGHWFKGRKEMMPTSFLRQWGAGIDGNADQGTAAIVLSGSYADSDHGDELIYTGAGGYDLSIKKQVKDQSWENTGNSGLLKSMNDGLPVRVIRGYTHKSPYSPKTGYTYAGLYSVVDAWLDGQGEFKLCRFRLVYSGRNEERKSTEIIELNYNARGTQRKEGVVLRIIRNTKTANDIKKLYDHQCQICGIAIKTRSGVYAEGAHIRPLGKPHDGDDNSDNLICLCPNHHVMFDKGCFSILDDLSLIGDISGTLNILSNHKLEPSNLAYHRSSHGYD